MFLSQTDEHFLRYYCSVDNGNVLIIYNDHKFDACLDISWRNIFLHSSHILVLSFTFGWRKWIHDLFILVFGITKTIEPWKVLNYYNPCIWNLFDYRDRQCLWCTRLLLMPLQKQVSLISIIHKIISIFTALERENPQAQMFLQRQVHLITALW